MENKFFKVEDREKWQALLDKVLFKTFFHFLEWEDFLESQFKWLKFERYLWKDQVILSLARVKIRGKEKLISHPFCEYGGPLPLIEKIDGRQFQKDLFEEFKTPLKISFHPQLLPYFESMEFTENQRESFFFEELGKKTTAELQQNLDRNRHRSIKLALSQNFQTEQCRSLKDLKDLYVLYIKSLRKHKALVYPFSFFEFFLENPQAKISLLKTKKGDLIGGNIFIMYDKISHSFLCGFNEKYKDLGAHSLVLWQEVERSKESGCEKFDFGATKKDSSIRDFKNRWGAVSYPIFELRNYSGESKLKDSFLRDVWSYLPTGLIKVLSPHFIKYKL